MRAKTEGDIDIQGETQRRNEGEYGEGERIDEEKLQREKEEENGENKEGREKEENEELKEVLESFRWYMGKFGEGSSRTHEAVETPGYCKQMSRGKGGESPTSLPLSCPGLPAWKVITLGFLNF